MKGGAQKGVVDGLSAVEKCKPMKLRGEVKDGQKPTKTKGTVKSDRGSFPCA